LFILFPGQEYRDILFRINQLIVHPVAIHEKVIFLEKQSHFSLSFYLTDIVIAIRVWDGNVAKNKTRYESERSKTSSSHVCYKA